MISRSLLTLLIVGSTKELPQSTATDQTDKEYCSHEKRLGYFHPMDSTRRRIVLDSVNKLLVGQWQLIDVSTKIYTVMHTPADSIAMSIDEQGKAAVSVKGKQSLSFQIAASTNYGNLRLVVSEVGRNYFRFKTPRVRAGQKDTYYGETICPNGLRVCEACLELYGFTSAGPYYVFRRLTPMQPENKRRN